MSAAEAGRTSPANRWRWGFRRRLRIGNNPVAPNSNPYPSLRRAATNSATSYVRPDWGHGAIHAPPCGNQQCDIVWVMEQFMPLLTATGSVASYV